MAYRIVFLALLVSGSPAFAARVAVLVGGAAERAEAVTRVVRAHVIGATDELVETATPAGELDDAALAALREKLGVARVVAVTLQRQGKQRFLVSVRAADASGVTRRYGEAGAATLAEDVGRVTAELPPLPTPTPPVASASAPATTAAATTATATTAPATATSAPATSTPAPATTGDAPAPAEVAPPPPAPTPAAPSTPAPHRKHEYGLLIGGLVAFFVPWLATVGFAAHYLDYNPNAARAGFAPIAGPFLARRHISDKDLSDGYDVGLTVDGAIQIVGFSVLVAGILYAAIGIPDSKRHAQRSSWQPLFAGGPRGAAVGAVMSW